MGRCLGISVGGFYVKNLDLTIFDGGFPAFCPFDTEHIW
jgi:hypothetical protein